LADLPPYPDSNAVTGDDTDIGPALGSTTGTPRWVKVFGIIAIVLVVLVILMLTGVFGEGHGPGRHLGGAPGDTPASSGRKSTGGAGGPAVANEAARTVEVTTLDTMAFKPTRINVSAGETVTFVVTNTGQAIHEFTLGDAAMQQQHAEAMAHIPDGMGHDTTNSITLQPGETKRLTWRFGDTGMLEYGCHQRGHYQAGMRGQITIT
jgi:uncharacterized cupredoxin-like copper-binding protein